jgi:hypothetical protein
MHILPVETATLNELFPKPNLQVITGKSVRSRLKQTVTILSELLKMTAGATEVMFGGAMTL